MKKPVVYLVGAGPGDPELITMRGAKLLGRADCVIYDRLASAELLSLARNDAELISVGKRAGEHSYMQNEINALLVAKAKEGKIIVRLKGGDPCIFGRGAEEAAALAEAGIDFEIVPGVTAALGASAYSGIMLTNREHSSAVAFITGHESDTKTESSLDFEVLSKFGGTLVFYMGIGNLYAITSGLMSNGMDDGTPAAVVADATLSSQRVVNGSVKDISRLCSEANIQPPALVIIGRCAKVDEQLAWQGRRTLSGQTVVLTRDRHGNIDLREKLKEYGAGIIECAAIEIVDCVGQSGFDAELEKIGRYDWVFFTSANGVASVFEHLATVDKDARVFAHNKIAAIGTRTADELAGHGIRADFVPVVFTTEAMGREFVSKFDMAGKKVLLLRSALANNELVELLEGRGAKVKRLDVYTTRQNEFDAELVMKQINAGDAQWISFTSASTVDAFFARIDPGTIREKTKIFSIGPVTSAQVRKYNLEVDVEAMEHTAAGMVEALCDYCKRK